jgi:phosphatidylglycerophosphate synthase
MGHEQGIRLSPILAIWLLGSILGIPLTLLVARDFGAAAGLRFALFLALAYGLATLVVRALRRRIGPEPNRLGVTLTLTRLVTGCALAAFILSGARDRFQGATVVLWAFVLLTATLSDWFDGALNRREGATRLADVLDIESDSWLTLWSAVAAILLGGLPWICLVPPAVRYIHPILALHAGKLPAGGGPWWSRVTGMTQMAMLMAGFAPIGGVVRDAIFGVVVWPISLAQLATMLALLAVRRR